MEKAINNAKWVAAPSEFAAPVISRTFTVSKVKTATIAISALGFFCSLCKRKKNWRRILSPLSKSVQNAQK